MIKKLIFLAGLFSVTLLNSTSSASTFYIDPQHGSMSNDGSAAQPWSTLEEVFKANKIESYMFKAKPAEPGAEMIIKNENAPVKGGDTLVVRTGYHGRIYAAEYYNTDYITIIAESNNTPRVAAIELRSVCKWIISGLTVSPQFDTAYKNQTLIQFSSHGWTGPSYDCIVEKCTAYSIENSSGWSATDWDSKACNGISLPGTKMIAKNNYLKNVNFGIIASGDSALVENNIVENFSGDGIRGLGDYGIFQYNTIKNCYDVNANHDDGFQSWSVGEDGNVGTGVVKGIIFRGNTIINYEDPNQPHRGSLQGIGCFDGMFEDWVVENNVIMVDHWHGISLYGAVNCRIVNNTVVDLNENDPGPPWIKITEHKNGTSPADCIVRNNLTSNISCSGTGVTIDNNIKTTAYDDFFVNYSEKNLHLKPGCSAIGAGSPELAPVTDRDGHLRNSSSIDIGAYMFQSSAKNRVPLVITGPQNPSNGSSQVFNLAGRSVGKSLSGRIDNTINRGKTCFIYKTESQQSKTAKHGIYLKD